MSSQYGNQFDYNKYIVDQYATGQKRLGDDYYGGGQGKLSADAAVEVAAPQAANVQQSQGPSTGQTAANVGTNAAVGGAMGGPGGAAIAAGGTLLTSYIAQKAADERQRRQNAAAIEQNYAQNQTSAYNSILGNLGKALR